MMIEEPTEGYEEQLCEKAFEVWGEDAQTTMVMGELAELITEISHYKRGRSSQHDLAEEIADVKICLRQLESLVPDYVLNETYVGTLHDLEEKLEGRND